MAVDDDGLLYVARCNGTIQVYDQQQMLVRDILTGNTSAPQSVCLGAKGSLYYTDAANSSVITQLDHAGQVMQTFQSSDPDTEFLTAAYDDSDDSVWATDASGYVWHFDADGSVLSQLYYNTSDVTLLLDIAVDGYNGQLQIISTHGEYEGVTEGTWLLTVDMDSGRLLANTTIPNVSLGISVAIDPNTGRLYIADGLDEQIVFFDPTAVAAAAVSAVDVQSKVD
jgi:DNA-binding beta-propeller fold protein YncE